MPARTSSDAGARLSRSKSTSSVHRHPPPILEPFDPDVAKEQALAAATIAFARAQAHDVAERASQRSSEFSRSKSNASRKSLTSKGQGSHFPPRDSSFRSNKAQPTRRDSDRRQQTRASTTNNEKFPSFYPASGMEKPVSAPRPLSAQPSIAFSEHSRPATQPKTGRPTASSSITSQQIRKARSMYYASSVQTGSPIARPPVQYLTSPPPVTAPSPTEISTTIRPTPALRSASPAELRIPIKVATDESVDKARDKHLQNFQQRSIKHKPSLFLAPFIKRQDKGNDKTKRFSSGLMTISTSNERSPVESVVDMTLNDFMPQPDKKEKRSFSGSLKSKIRRVFRRPSKTSPSLPVQQIEASRDYHNAQRDIPIAGIPSDIPSPDEDILRRIRSRTPSVEARHSSLFRSESRTSSNGSGRSNLSSQSLHSELNATNPHASRMTSWSTSSTGDALAQRALKRLTVIHEARDSIGSEADRIASASVPRKMLPLGAFRDPMPMESLLEESSVPIDPKRVFSALMKEIESAKADEETAVSFNRALGAESDVFESNITNDKLYCNGVLHLNHGTESDTSPESGPEPSFRLQNPEAQSALSTIHTVQTKGRTIRPTIRPVTPGDQRLSPCPKRLAAFSRGSEGDTSSSASTAESEEACININTRLMQDDPSTQLFLPSAAQIEKRVEKTKDRWKTPLDDIEKLQFPRETNRTYEVADFTQRTILYKSPRSPIDTDIAPRTDIPALCDSPISPPPRPVMSPLSPSVYSRNTDGISILPNDSVMSFNDHGRLGRQHDGGSAVILTSQSVRSYIVGTPSPRRPVSTRSSRDWKAWLSNEVSGMEFTSQENLTIHEHYMSHLGKQAEQETSISPTENDDTTVILRPSCDTVTPFAEPNTNATAESCSTQDNVLHANVDQEQSLIATSSSALERSQPRTDTFKATSQKVSPSSFGYARAPRYGSRPGSIPLLSTKSKSATSKHIYSSSQPLIESPISARMNDRFPFINTGRNSSSNSARSSRMSRSPPDSITSSMKSRKATPSPRIYSDLSAPPTQRTSQRLSNINLEKDECRLDSKENAAPSLACDNSVSRSTDISPHNRVAYSKSLQLLSSAALNRNTTNMSRYTTNASASKRSKHDSSPAPTPSRPPIRAIVRPISPDKLSRRPKSAFDLRGPKISLPRPTSEFRRPALHLKTSASSLALNKELSPGEEERVIDSILEDHQRSGSVTPGQRMADRFLRERKSTGGLESVKHRGGLKLVREDTPAFL